jgi:predicted nucleic acid-binding protein
MSVFTDSSAFVALLANDDRNHQSAWATWNRLLSADEFIRTSNYVVSETVAVLQRRIGIEGVREFVEGPLGAMEIDWVSPEAHHRGMSALVTAGRRDLSLVDCVSFDMMRELGIEAAFTFDPHFAEQGFECVPAPPAGSP